MVDNNLITWIFLNILAYVHVATSVTEYFYNLWLGRVIGGTFFLVASLQLLFKPLAEVAWQVNTALVLMNMALSIYCLTTAFNWGQREEE